MQANTLTWFLKKLSMVFLVAFHVFWECMVKCLWSSYRHVIKVCLTCKPVIDKNCTPSICSILFFLVLFTIKNFCRDWFWPTTVHVALYSHISTLDVLRCTRYYNQTIRTCYHACEIFSITLIHNEISSQYFYAVPNWALWYVSGLKDKKLVVDSLPTKKPRKYCLFLFLVWDFQRCGGFNGHCSRPA